ncbi:hypothetical protein HPP92_019299 [Vanilla planifolia]|uniref:Phosphatidate phosphatase n=1 Tax=Vanilla planifolia TaxID=51239 RepID=A0A835Q6J6_VANPL|nr:hypothetical protein HPP92_019299 [Vanilla planifolia]
MNVVGRVSNLISQGVYSVATPFHPFGGAVDIIVVEQEDGTYRSTPWYVRFGKFQGIIKGAEKVVTIAVNDLAANFHMYLDSSGQAYFMQEVMTGSNDGESSEPVLNESNGMGNGEQHLETGQGEKIEENNSDPHDIFDENGEYAGADVQLNGSKDEKSAVGNTSMSNRFKKYHYGNLEDVEDVVKSSNDANSEMVLVSVDGHVLTVPISANETAAENLQLDTPQFHLGPGDGSGEEFGSGGVIWEDDLYVDMEGCNSKEEGSLRIPSEYVPNDAKRVSFQMEQVQSIGIPEAISSSDNAIASFTKEETFKSCLDLTSYDMNFRDMGIVTEDLLPKDSFELLHSSSSVDNVIVSEASVKDGETAVIFENVELKSTENNISTNSKLSDNLIGIDAAISEIPFNELSIQINEVEEVPKNSLATIDKSQVCSNDISINDTLKQTIENQDATPTEGKSNQIEDQVSQSSISSLGFEISLCGNLLSHGMGRIAAEEAFNTHRVHEDVFKVSGPSIINSGNLIVRYKDMYFTWDKAVIIVLGKAVYGSGFSCDIKDSITIDPKDITHREDMQIALSSSSSSSRRWRLWPIPFRRSRTLQHSNSDSSNEDLFVDTDPGSQAPYVEQDLGT